MDDVVANPRASWVRTRVEIVAARRPDAQDASAGPTARDPTALRNLGG